MKATRILIIGAGLGGLAVGTRLAADGYHVKIIEQTDAPGGWLKPTRANGFCFQNGGMLITAPFLLDKIFLDAGMDRSEYIQLKSVSPVFQAIFPDHEQFLHFREPAITQMKNRSFSPEDQKGFHDYGKFCDKALDTVFFDYCASPLSERHLILQRSPRLRRFQSETTARKMALKRFSTTNMRRLYSFWPLLVGGNPSQTSHLYSLISTMIQRWDAFVPLGGADSIINGLVRLFTECGGEIQYNSTVETVQVFNQRATGVQLVDGSIHQADIIISDVDAATTYRKLIDSDRFLFSTVRKARNKKIGSSVFVYHMGLREPLQESYPLAPFNIIFPEVLNDMCDQIFKRQIPPIDPLIFLCFPSKIDSTAAPDGNESITAIVPVPNLENGIDWQQESFKFRNLILDKMQPHFKTDIRSNLICERTITPQDIEINIGNCFGSAFSFDPAIARGEPPRMANKSPSIENLFLVGAGAHPGPLFPGILSGAALTERIIVKKLNQVDKEG